MNGRLLTLLIIYSINSGSASADENQFPPIFFQNPIERFQPTQYSQFNLIENELRNLIAKNGDINTSNIFCASGFSFIDDKPLVIVIWTNKEQLHRWRGTIDPQERKESKSLWLAPYSDMKNAVEDGVILGGPTTINRSQAKAAIEDCEKYGQKFLVRPFTPVKEKSEDDEDF